ncbi:hypothetical protein ACFQ9Q_43385, partial [Streptomyces virginiae]|uniref:hypothetical protein n=1 Tax=Streptomyces virginiae TaxID=1961 RepID=UPI0036B746FB
MPSGAKNRSTSAGVTSAREGGLPTAHQRGERKHEGLGADEVGGGALHQDAALDGALVGDVELARGEVP